MAKEVSKKINEATDIVILQNKDICNRIRSTENDIKKHINSAEECILEALEGLRIDNVGGSGSGSGDIITNAILEKDIIADVTIGGIQAGDTIKAGTTFTQFVERLFTVLRAGIVNDPTMKGYANISAPIIKVSILGQDGNYSQVYSGDIIKENSKLKIEIEIPTSETKNTDAKILRTTTVLAHGYIKKKDDTIDLNGAGNCEIGTKVVSEGNDYVTIASKGGCFNEFKIEDGTTKITAILSDVNEDGSLKVKSVSKTYKVLSDSNYVVYAKSNKEETLEEIEKDDDRVYKINKDGQIGLNLSDTADSEEFKIKIETWGVVPSVEELKTGGTVIINAPTIEVTKSGGVLVNSGVKLLPTDEITVKVRLNGNSYVRNASAYLQKTAGTFQYGWEKIKDGKQIELIKDPINQNCMIGFTLSEDEDTEDKLLFYGTPSGIFEKMQIDADKNEINFGPTKVDSTLSNNSFSVLARSGIHKILSDANYQINAISNIYSTGKNNSETNYLTIEKDKILKTFNSKSSAVSSFNFELLEEETQKELFYKIIQYSELGTILQSANTYNPLTENNLINDLGFAKYTYGNNPVSISGGWCLIMSSLNISEISAIDAMGLNISITNTNKNIGEYKVYYIQLDKSSTATIKIN